MERQDIEGLIDNLVIILDTNILLYLYKCSFSTSSNIVDLLNKVRDKICIPFRVHEEYKTHKHEAQAKIDSKYDNFTKAIKKQVADLQKSITDSIAETRKYDFPDSDVLQTNLDTAFLDTIHIIDEYNNSLNSEKSNKTMQITAVETLVQWFETEGKVRETPNILTILEYVKEGELRYRYKMPPGFMDEEEKDKAVTKDKKFDNFHGRIRKFGDLFVWKDILEIGKELAEQNRHVLFLTNDVKEDWWVVKGEPKNLKAIKMRDELYDEYSAYVGNGKIEFMRLSDFYSLFSDYYEMQDIKTQLELDYDSYVRTVMDDKYREKIENEINRSIEEIEWDSIFETSNLIKPDIECCDGVINNTNIHYDTQDEYAIYDVQMSVPTYPIEVFRTGTRKREFLGTVELILKFMFEIHRDLRHLEDEAIELKTFVYETKNQKEPWEVQEDLVLNAKAEIADSLEDAYAH